MSVTRSTQALVWESPRLKAKFTNPVLHDGFVYGLDDGVLVCLDPANGERRWKAGRYGHGQTLLVGNRLLVQTEDGEIVLVEATPRCPPRDRPVSASSSSKTWNPPALAGRLPARAHGYAKRRATSWQSKSKQLREEQCERALRASQPRSERAGASGARESVSGSPRGKAPRERLDRNSERVHRHVRSILPLRSSQFSILIAILQELTLPGWRRQ